MARTTKRPKGLRLTAQDREGTKGRTEIGTCTAHIDAKYQLPAPETPT